MIKRDWRSCSLVILVYALVAASLPAIADECSDVLKSGVFNKFHYKNEKKFSQDLRLILGMSREELEQLKSAGGGGISIPLIDFGLSVKANSEAYRRLREELRIDETLNWQASGTTIVELEMADPGILDAWKECMRGRFARRIMVSLRGSTSEPNGEFLVHVKYIPTAKTDPPSYTITDFTVSGAEPVGQSDLRKDAKLESFSGISAVYKRKGLSAVEVQVETSGGTGDQGSLAAIAPEKKKEKETVRTVTIPASPGNPIKTPAFVPPMTGGDADFDSNNDNYAQFELRAWLELAQNDTQLFIRVSMRGRETEPDHTSVEGITPADARYLLYQAPPGGKIVQIVSPSVREDVLSFRDYGKNDLAEWSHQVRHYSQASFNAKLNELRQKQFPLIPDLFKRVADNLQRTTTITNNGLVGDWEVLGDTDGDEAGSKTYVSVTLLPITIKVKETSSR